MQGRVLEKLEWSGLLDILSGYSQTEDGRRRCHDLRPDLDREAVEDRWGMVMPLKALAGQGYLAPIGELLPLTMVFRAASLGQVLIGPDLRSISTLLDSVKDVQKFADDFADRCVTLRRVGARIYPLPNLAAAIDRAVGPEGQLLDDASDELKRVRRQKVGMRKRIEEQLSKLLRDSELEMYLQDDFFTVRSERYVVPMRLDGRGRVKGSILDTSDSGQTLFIEPAAIAPLNEQLLELDVAEKLEVLRIFRELSSMVASELDNLQINYEEMIELDFLTAQAKLAARIDAGTARLVDRPRINLHAVRHPLISRSDGRGAVANDVSLEEAQSSLIVSGPNAGGKTVVLKTIGIVHLMAKAGLLLPVNDDSEMYLFNRLFVELGDAQSLTANLSTFSGHILGLKPILENANGTDLALLDELAVGTDPHTGAAIAQAVLEELADRNVCTLVTTHFDSLKGIAVKDDRFRNGSMEFSFKTLKPTYKLILDVPGQSYGIEVAEQMGLASHLIERAKELRGHGASVLEDSVNQLMKARDETARQQDELLKEKLAAEAEKVRWSNECEMVAEVRRKTAKKLTERFERQMVSLNEEFEDITKQVRKAYKIVQASGGRQETSELHAEMLGAKKEAGKRLREMEEKVAELAKGSVAHDELPGRAAERAELQGGTRVFVVPLHQDGKVVKAAVEDEDSVEIQIGMIKLRTSIRDLRIISNKEAKSRSTSRTGDHKPKASPPKRRDSAEGLVIQTPTNSIDLRGMDVDSAIEASWNFIDKSMLRGEPAIILIHGHGTDRLKKSIRQALDENCPYDVAFRPGDEAEGGDGVTVVALRTT